MPKYSVSTLTYVIPESLAVKKIFTLVVVAALTACAGGGGGSDSSSTPVTADPAPEAATPQYRYSSACGEDSHTVATSRASLLIGGANANAQGEVEAMQWLIDHAAGGDLLVLRVGDIGSQASWVCDNFAGNVGSAAELAINDRTAANTTAIADYIDRAEIIYIAGGDQTQYKTLWQDSAVEDALNRHLFEGKPIAGTSAGLAILGQSYYAPATNGVNARELLDDPYHAYSDSISYGDFLIHPQLANIITDTHLNRVRDGVTRHGRVFGFLARSIADRSSLLPRAIGVEEGTFFALGSDGVGKVFGEGQVFFLKPNIMPELILANNGLVWDNNGEAVSVYRIQGNLTGNGSFDLNTWTGAGGQSSFWFTTDGYDGFNCPTGC